jgi:hypothetical protein
LGRPLEEWRSVSISVGIDVCALVGASVVVGRQPACRWHWCAAVWLISSRMALASVAVPLTGLLLQRNVLRRSSVVGLVIDAKLLV